MTTFSEAPPARPLNSDRRRPILARESVLVVFVDGLPWLDAGLVIPPDWSRVPLIPSLGYSVNIEAELFAGVSPDELGWFGEWNPTTLRPPWQRFLADLASVVRRNVYADYAAHRLLELLFRERLFNVPLDCLAGVSRSVRLPYGGDFDRPSIFSEFDLVPVYDPATGFVSDAEATTAALAAMRRGVRKVFVPLVELDGLTHRTGLKSVERAEHLRNTRRRIATLWEQIIHSDPNAAAVVVSDHGFAGVDSAATIDTNELRRRAGGRKGAYIVDATILRVWCRDAHTRVDVEEFLIERGDGHVLTSDERRRHRITSRSFGDLIYVLDEGRMFLPSIMTKRTLCAAMHGYCADAARHWGVAASSERVFDGATTPVQVFEGLSR